MDTLASAILAHGAILAAALAHCAKIGT